MLGVGAYECFGCFCLYRKGWSYAIVLGKFPVPGRPTNLDSSSVRDYCVYSRCLDCFFLSFIIPLFLFPPSGRRSDIN